MQIEAQNIDLKGAYGVPRQIVQSIPTRKLQAGNKKDESITNKNKLFSNLTIRPILSQSISEELSVAEVRQVAKLMTDATRNLTGSIDFWEFDEDDGLDDLILRCGNRLADRAAVDHIEIFRGEEKEMQLVLRRFIENRDKIYCIQLIPVFKLRSKNRLLFNVLLSFIKNLPFDSIFNTCEDRIDWIWTYLFEELEYYKEMDNSDYEEHLKGSVGFFARYEAVYNDFQETDWKSQLANYYPRKNIYREIKKLLLASEEVDFNSPWRVSVRDEYDCLVYHNQTFLIVDCDESDFTRAYIDMFNENSYEYDIMSAYSCAIVKEGNVGQFEENIGDELLKLENFICDLNDLIRQL